jgi:radical SAM protein with 4Fe4S-binding SPASM domain
MELLRLKEQYKPISYGDHFVLFNNSNQEEFHITKDQFGFIGLLNGTRTENEILSFLKNNERDIGVKFVANLRKIKSIEVLSKKSKRLFPSSYSPYLEAVHIDITSLCNLRCHHCYVSSYYNNRKGKDLTTKEWFGVIDDLNMMNVRNVSLTGGEPTQRSDLREIIDYFLSKNILVDAVFTNGSNIDTHWIQYLKRLKYPCDIYISLDGHTPWLNSIIRGNQNIYNKVLGAINLFVDAGFRVNVNTTINRYNVIHLNKMYDFVKSLNVHRWRISPPKPLGNFVRNKDSLMVRWEALLKSYRDLIDQHLSEARNVGSCLNMPIRLDIELLFRTEMIDSTINYFSSESNCCAYYRNRCAIKPNGDVLPCSYFEKNKIGNLRRESMLNIWTSQEMQKFKQMTVNNISKCSDCIDMPFCGAGCRAMAYCIEGEMDASDDYACKQVPFFKTHVIPLLLKYGFAPKFAINSRGYV